MKLIAFAIPLMLSGAAFAQPATDSITPAPGMTATMAVPDSTAPGGMTTLSVTTPASNKIIQPDNSNPRRDSHGIAVRSEPAVVPDGWNGVTGSAAMGGPIDDSANVQTVATTSGAPVCSATVTDHCTETYWQGATSRS